MTPEVAPTTEPTAELTPEVAPATEPAAELTPEVAPAAEPAAELTPEVAPTTEPTAEPTPEVTPAPEMAEEALPTEIPLAEVSPTVIPDPVPPLAPTGCLHINKEEWTNYNEITGETWHDSGDGTHTRLADLYAYWYCDACDEGGSTLLQARVEQTEEHWFLDGVCDYCGVNNPCTHPNKEESTQYGELLDEPWLYETWHDNGDGTHTRLAGLYAYWYCDACGEVSYTLIQAPVEQTENHLFDDGVCLDCGAVTPCPHTHKYGAIEEREIPGETWHDNGDGTHTRLVDEYWVWDCPDCGESNETFVRAWVEQTEEHDFRNGACTFCGVANTCPHTNRNEWTSSQWTYRDNGDGTHTQLHNRYANLYCYDCGEQSESLLETTEEQTYEHYFSDGVCYYCGVANPCPHTNSYEYPYYQGIDGEAWQDNGDGTHSRLANQYKHWYCNNCPESGITLIQASVEQTEKHSFSDGVCDYCGLANPCPHTNKYEGNTNYREIPGETWHDNGGDTHTRLADQYAQWYCHDCYESGNTLIQARVEQTEKHSFSDGECYYCGVANICTHPEKAGSVSRDTVEDWHDAGDGTHEAIFDEYFEWSCLHCGECGRDLLEENVTIHEPHHNDGNDTCYLCGAKMEPCQHVYQIEYFWTYPNEYTYTDNGDGTHTGPVTTHYECVLCRSHYEVVDEHYTSKHCFDFDIGHNDICVFCGAINVCLHEKTIPCDAYVDNKYIDNDDGTHTLIRRDSDWVLCSTCGLEIDKPIDEPVIRIIPHKYKDGVCCDCGAKLPPCEHKHLREKYDYQYVTDAVDNGDGTHTRIADMIKTWVCQDCYTWLPSLVPANKISRDGPGGMPKAL